MHSERYKYRVIYPVYRAHFFRPEFSSFAFAASALASASAYLLEREVFKGGLGTSRCLAFSSLSLRIMASRARSARAWSVLPASCNFQYRSFAAAASSASLHHKSFPKRDRTSLFSWVLEAVLSRLLPLQDLSWCDLDSLLWRLVSWKPPLPLRILPLLPLLLLKNHQNHPLPLVRVATKSEMSENELPYLPFIWSWWLDVWFFTVWSQRSQIPWEMFSTCIQM